VAPPASPGGRCLCSAVVRETGRLVLSRAWALGFGSVKPSVAAEHVEAVGGGGARRLRALRTAVVARVSKDRANQALGSALLTPPAGRLVVAVMRAQVRLQPGTGDTPRVRAVPRGGWSRVLACESRLHPIPRRETAHGP
jgi:hypothetical protein